MVLATHNIRHVRTIDRLSVCTLPKYNICRLLCTFGDPRQPTQRLLAGNFHFVCVLRRGLMMIVYNSPVGFLTYLLANKNEIDYSCILRRSYLTILFFFLLLRDCSLKTNPTYDRLPLFHVITCIYWYKLYTKHLNSIILISDQYNLTSSLLNPRKLSISTYHTKFYLPPWS